MNKNKGSWARINAAERRRKALELRKTGATYELIAMECGFRSRSSAYEAVTNAIRELTQDAAQEVLVLELERLDRLMLGIWEKARAGELACIDRVLKIMERRAVLCGLEATTATATETSAPLNATARVMVDLLHDMRTRRALEQNPP